MISKTIDIIGVQMDLGAVRKGVDMGPSAIRHAGLLHKIKDLGYEILPVSELIYKENYQIDNEGKQKSYV